MYESYNLSDEELNSLKFAVLDYYKLEKQNTFRPEMSFHNALKIFDQKIGKNEFQPTDKIDVIIYCQNFWLKRNRLIKSVKGNMYRAA